MMNSLINFWARNTVAANLLMFLAVLGGVLGFATLEKETFPGGEFAGASIHVTWPGASPAEVEEQIVVRIEEAVADIDGIDKITSGAQEGLAGVYIRALKSVDKKEFLDEVKLRVDSINNLPDSAFRPTVSQFKSNNEYFGMVIYGDVDPRDLKRIVENVRDEVARLPGAELAYTNASLSEEVTIELSEDAMRAFNLTFDEVANAIRQASLNSSGGEVRTDTGSVSIQTRQLADTSDQFANIIVRQTENGGLIRLGDIARIDDGFVDGELAATFNGTQSSFIMIPQTDQMDLPSYSKGLHEYIKEKNQTLPDSVRIDLLWDDNQTMGKLISIIGNSAVLGTLLVLAVLILFLRPIVAFWVSVGILTAFAGGFALLPLMGVSLNILTLFACLLVIGIVVDDAIVIGENIHTEIESGRREGVEAAIHATQQVAKPVTFGVITTMIAFAPWALLSGDERQFTQNFTLTVIAALTFSLIEAFLILPAHLSHLKRQGHDGKTGGFTRFQRRIADSLLWVAQNIYRPMLRIAVRARYATAAFFVAVFMFAIGIVSHGYVPFKLMPEVENAFIFVDIEMPQGTPFSRTIEVRDQVANGIELLKAEENPKWAARGYDDIVTGASVIAFDDGMISWVQLMEPEFRPREVSTKELANRLRDLTGPIPDAQDVRFDFSFTNDDDRLKFALNHDDLEVLRAAADELKEHLGTYADAFNIGDDLAASSQEIRLSLKPGAQSMGVNLFQVSNQVRQAYYGEEVQRLPRNGDDVRVMLKLPEQARRSLDSLNNFRIRTQDGREIPLTSVADLDFAPGITTINREDRRRAIVVFAEISSDRRGEIAEKVRDEFLPELMNRYPGLGTRTSGAAEGEADFFAEVTMLLLLALLVMYCVLAVAFRSYSQPVLIMLAIPFAFAGAVFGHLIMGIPMALFSVFGIAAGAGVVINDNLVLIDYLNRKREEGMHALEAVIESGVARFRPILLTSITTFIGILPMIMDRSSQAAFLRPMVVSLGCAVVFALFISLFMVPALYAVGVEIRRFFLWMSKGVPYRTIGDRYHDDKVESEGLGQPAE